MLLLGIAAGMMLARRNRAEPRPEPKFRQITFDPGLEEEPTLSPDGRMLAYVTDDAGNLDIRILPLPGGQAISVADSPADEAQPAWSPDGSRLAFVSARDRGGRLYVALGLGLAQQYIYGRRGDLFLVPALGGTPVKLVEEGYYPAWSPDGKKIVFQSQRGGHGDLWIIDAGGGTPRQITNDLDFDYHPSWSPDGKWIVYCAQKAARTSYDVRVIPAEGGRPQPVTDEHYMVVAPSWSPDGKQILFSSDRSGSMNIWKVPFVPKSKRVEVTERVTVGEGNDINVATYSGRGIAFATVRSQGDIWNLDLASGKLQQVTLETAIEDYPHLSPDGKTLLILSRRSGEDTIWTVDERGKLVNRLGSGIMARWSPDGQQVAYIQVEAGTGMKLVVQRIGDVTARELASDAIFPDWSPDGKLIAFSRQKEGTTALLVKSVGSGTETQITSVQSNSPACPDWSADGKWIAFQADREGVRHIWIVPSSGGTPRQLTTGESESSHPQWSPLKFDQILFVRDHKNLFLLSVSTGQVRQITNFTDSNLVVDYPSWSFDGKKIYFARHKKVGDVFLLENY